MAYSDYLVERVRQRISDRYHVVEKRMMGGLVFMVNGKMCAAVDKDRKTGDDRVMVRIGKDRWEAVLQRPGCREMDFTGRSMKGFVFAYPEGFDREEDLDELIALALAFNAQLTGMP
ncbi:MAG: TfoX/Sxy family protein [Bacteroidota bacterium]